MKKAYQRGIDQKTLSIADILNLELAGGWLPPKRIE
jgi:hypothetical protein